MFKQPLIAIDIGSSAIKVVELTGRQHKKLRAIGLETLPRGSVVDGVVQDSEVVQRGVASGTHGCMERSNGCV